MGSWRSFGSRTDTSAYSYSADQAQRDAEIERRSRKLNIISFAVIIIFFIVYSMFFQTGSITAAMDDQSIGVVTLQDETIAFLLSDIESVEFHIGLSDFERGTMQSGAESSSCYSGTYINDSLGEYQLHVNLKVNCYVIVHYTDGILVFNTDTADNTEALYKNLNNAVNS